MSAKKRKDDGGGVAVAEPQAGKNISRAPVVAAAIVAALVGGSYGVWQLVRPHLMAAQEYQIDPARIAITPPPSWIRADIAAEALRDAGFEGSLSLLDGDLTVRVANAFAAHPWVAHVDRVSKRFPARLDVVLSYRKPVAMVEVEGGAGALPVDFEGIVLPTADFSPSDADAYPRIGEIHTTPAGTVGKLWGDPSVTGAAQIAAALAGDWKDLHIQRIVPAGQKAGKSGAEPIFKLLTASGAPILWGRAPATSMPGEVPAGEKIAQLKRYAAQNNNSLEVEGGGQLEIRDDGALFARPRAEVKPLPKKGE